MNIIRLVDGLDEFYIGLYMRLSTYTQFEIKLSMSLKLRVC